MHSSNVMFRLVNPVLDGCYLQKFARGVQWQYWYKQSHDCRDYRCYKHSTGILIGTTGMGSRCLYRVCSLHLVFHETPSWLWVFKPGDRRCFISSGWHLAKIFWKNPIPSRLSLFFAMSGCRVDTIQCYHLQYCLFKRGMSLYSSQCLAESTSTSLDFAICCFW